MFAGYVVAGRAQRIGIRAFLSKPATLDTLSRTLHAALNRDDTAARP